MAASFWPEGGGEKHDKPRRRKLKVCLATSSGGHLSELRAITAGLDDDDRMLVTVDSSQARSEFGALRRYYVRRLERIPANLLVNAAQALSILVREKPDVVVSTGSGDVVPLMLLAALLGIPVVFAESVARINHPSLTGRLVKHWTSLVIVPWPSLKDAYPGSISVAPLVACVNRSPTLPELPSIVLLTGTGARGFERLVRGVDDLIGDGRLKGDVFAQIGSSTYIPRNLRYARFLPHEELVKAIQSSDLVITHCGAGSMRDSLSAGKLTIVVPRDPSRGEVLYRSSAELAQHLESLGWVIVVRETSELPNAVAKAQVSTPSRLPLSGPLASEVVSGFLDSLREDLQHSE